MNNKWQRHGGAAETKKLTGRAIAWPIVKNEGERRRRMAQNYLMCLPSSIGIAIRAAMLAKGKRGGLLFGLDLPPPLQLLHPQDPQELLNAA